MRPLSSRARRTTSVVSTLLALSLVLVACGESESRGTTSDPVEVGRLYVQKAASADLVVDGDDRRLVLDGVDPSTTWFTDRPVRQAGSMETGDFVAGWSEVGFAATPPNAVLQLESADRGSYVVELSAPEWDPSGAVLTYTVNLEGDVQPPPGDTGPVALFIDDGGGAPQAVEAVVTVNDLAASSQVTLTPLGGGTLSLGSGISVTASGGGPSPVELELTAQGLYFSVGDAPSGASQGVVIRFAVVAPADSDTIELGVSLPDGAAASLEFTAGGPTSQLQSGSNIIALPT